MASSSTGSRLLKLRSSDGLIFNLEEAVYMQMGKIKTMISDSHNEVGTFPISNVDSKTLAKVVHWCKVKAAVSGGVKKEVKVKEKKGVELWEGGLVWIDANEIFELITAANYLDVEPLFRRLCKLVSVMFKGKSEEEIRRLFNIKKDMNDQEKALIQRIRSWKC